MVGCYSLGLLILAYVAFAVRDISIWTPTMGGIYLKVAYSGMVAAAGGTAIIFFMRPFRIIHTIQAVPALPKDSQRTLHLQIESIRMFPGVKPKTVSIPVNDIRLSGPPFQERSSADASRVAEARRREAEAVRRLSQGNYLLLPFRQLGMHLSKGFRDLKHEFTRNPFIYLRAKGFNGSWKLDNEPGWALEDGRALARIMMSK
ncbi:MAG: hypothetical protein Q9224_000287 [Gallowayella concinna]